MNRTIVITPNVIDTLQALPFEQRLSIAATLTGELLLGADTSGHLSPDDEVIYTIVRSYVRRASAIYNRQA